MRTFRLSAFSFCLLAIIALTISSADAQQIRSDLPTRAEFESTAKFKPVDDKQIDLSGTWSGFRYQYDQGKRGYIQDFDYTFELNQKGNAISGTSLIMSEDGNYSEVNIRGIVLNGQLYFEEFSTNDEKKAQNRVWCYKVGALNVAQNNGALVMHGASNSFTSDHYFACTGGYTLLERVSGEELKPLASSKTDLENLAENHASALTISPNPFLDQTNVIFNLSTSGKATLEVFDLAGKQVAKLFNGKIEAGTHQFSFNAKDHGYGAGVFVAKLKVGDELHTSQLIQVD